MQVALKILDFSSLWMLKWKILSSFCSKTFFCLNYILQHNSVTFFLGESFNETVGLEKNEKEEDFQ